MSSTKSPRLLQALQARRRALLRQIVQSEPLIIGNVYDVMRRCGSPSCHCAAKPGHRQTLLIYRDKGRGYRLAAYALRSATSQRKLLLNRV